MLPEPVQAFIDAEIAANDHRYDDLRAVIFNGTLKRSPEESHTDGLIEISAHILRVSARGSTWSARSTT